MALLASARAASDTPSQQRRAWYFEEEERQRELERRRIQLEKQRPSTVKRIAEIRPKRRDTPLRSDNISDDEVREIELITIEVWPTAVVNVAGVVSGCPCEEGTRCSAQVWVVGYTPEKSVGMELSRVDNNWVVGEVQQWWIKFEALEARSKNFASPAEYLNARNALIDAFPSCAGAPALPELTPASPARP